MPIKKSLLLALCIIVFSACQEDTITPNDSVVDTPIDVPATATLSDYFGNNIDLGNLENYANQVVPNYITKDNIRGNEITNRGATLGRVLFYDKKLSVNDQISCASCHKQNLAFGDDLQASIGVDGTTGRHSMRLVNARFSEETRFFWDERAINLETQTTMPIRDHIEMGFSGENGDFSFSDLIQKLEGLPYYQELFQVVYGDANITEARMQNALAQFVRSMQSFDSKYDEGLAQANNLNQNFNNFSAEENLGKALFMMPTRFNGQGIRTGGGIGCDACHNAPEFDIEMNSANNGLITSIGGGTDTDVTRSPTLRDLLRQDGRLNGQMMHTGGFNSLEAMIDHYNNGIVDNDNLDNRLRPQGRVQNLAMSPTEKNAVVAFLSTLSSSTIYTDEKWSDPFID